MSVDPKESITLVIEGEVRSWFWGSEGGSFGGKIVRGEEAEPVYAVALFLLISSGCEL